MVSRTLESYIETIYALEMESGVAHTGDIAAELKVKPASVTEMIQKLSDMALVRYEPYHGVSLTSKGRRIAQDLSRTHRVLASFLTLIGVDCETAESDACQIEHHVTPKTMKQLTKFVNYIQDSVDGPGWLSHFKASTKSKQWVKD